MARVNRADQLNPEAVERAHLFNRLVRRGFLMRENEGCPPKKERI